MPFGSAGGRHDTNIEPLDMTNALTAVGASGAEIILFRKEKLS